MCYGSQRRIWLYGIGFSEGFATGFGHSTKFECLYQTFLHLCVYSSPLWSSDKYPPLLVHLRQIWTLPASPFLFPRWLTTSPGARVPHLSVTVFPSQSSLWHSWLAPMYPFSSPIPGMIASHSLHVLWQILLTPEYPSHVLFSKMILLARSVAKFGPCPIFLPFLPSSDRPVSPHGYITKYFNVRQIRFR
jgi:hypothetical protein